MTDREQNQSAPESPAQSPAPTEVPRTTTEQHIGETRKAAQRGGSGVLRFWNGENARWPSGSPTCTAPVAEPAAPAHRRPLLLPMTQIRRETVPRQPARRFGLAENRDFQPIPWMQGSVIWF